MPSSKRTLHHYYALLRGLSPKLLVVLLLVTGLLAAAALRSNNIRMIELRDKVFIADEEGSGVDEALNQLREYVTTHMNTDLSSGISIKPPIQLKHTYERLVEQEATRIRAHNAKVTTEAPAICEARFPAGQIRPRAACVDEYIAENTLQQHEVVPKELYQFDFISPRWSPDLAGLLVLVSALLASALIARLLIGVYLRHKLK